MTWKDFFAQLKSGDLQSVYLFSGAEEAMKREALAALEKALLPAGMEALNQATLEGATATAIIGAAETLPFMCERRLVVVRDWGPLLSGNSRDEERETARMLAWLDNPAPACVLVFYLRGNPDGRKKLPAALKKRGAEVRFEALSDAEILRWANRRLMPLGKTISAQAASHLVFTAGRDLTRLGGEVDKLAAFIGERGEIALEDIEEIVTPSPEFTVFEMLDFLFAGDAVRAERSVKTLLMSGEPYTRILGMVTRQLRMLTHMAFAQRAGGNAATVEKALKLHPYASKRAAQQARGLDPERLEALYLACAQAECDVKSSKLRDRAALQRVMLQIGEIRRPQVGTARPAATSNKDSR